MKVKEFIELLKKEDPELEIVNLQEDDPMFTKKPKVKKVTLFRKSGRKDLDWSTTMYVFDVDEKDAVIIY